MNWVKNKVLCYIDLSKCLKTNLICGLRIQLGPQTEDGEKIGLDSFTLYRTSIVRGRLQAKFHILRKFFDCLTAYLKGNMILSKFPLDQSSSTLK